FCNKNADGSGYCYLSYAGVRALPDPNAWAVVSATASQSGYVDGGMTASFNGVRYSCSTQDPLLSDRIFRLSSHNNLMLISSNSTGICTQVNIFADSWYSQ